ncbi:MULTISPECIES: MarR family transcriptional regulator [unclassified Caballeronia]|uniref:MarR family winged helix-turn-helix transcriptional regulator n=1 Tax=unclassified Caballeronia TaxID=2646786 RepID=UPI0028598741|nr:MULTISPECIES: MarR family transcriptional regulator [unclassified Caballeronia]MDR5752446.1 MarR family transcriptional regulator [Caballeronia sp. LZ024]MDR5845252.1 MarR family transcriptional regulator [Caballeronia sp. LZ031]
MRKGNESRTERAVANREDSSAGSDLRDLVSFQLRQLTNIYTKGSSSAYESRFGLTMNEWRCMALLHGKRGMSMNRLAEHAQFDRGLASRTVRGLEERGLLAREADVNDGRGVVITLTAQGKALVSQVFPIAEERNARLLSCLTRAEREILPGILEKLMNQARAMLDQEREEAELRSGSSNSWQEKEGHRLSV